MICSLVSCQDMEQQDAFFSFERVTREIFSKKEEFVLCICRFEESF